MNSSVVDYDFAKAWDQHQGSFAHGIAQKLLSYGERTNKNFKNVYDIVCGASNLLSFFNEKGLKCFGTETRQGMYEYSKEKIPTATYYHTKNMYELPGKEKIDLITCTHDIINYLEDFSEWELLFKNAAKRLNKHGLFMFDFYSKYKLSNWNETKYTSSPHLDCLTTVKSGIFDKTMITYQYYINYENFYIKTRDVVTECYYEADQVKEALIKAGFKNVQFVDENLNPLESLNYVERIYVLASKK